MNGRIGTLKLEYGNQTLNIINVYMPNKAPATKGNTDGLRKDPEKRQSLNKSELVMLGDWNFVEDQIDRIPQHAAGDRGLTGEMTKLKVLLELTDRWRKANPSTRSFTWEGTAGNDKRNLFSRINRIYGKLPTSTKLSTKTYRTTTESR